MTQSSTRQEKLVEVLLEKKRRLWSEVRRDLFDKVGDKLHAEYDIPQDVGDHGLLDVLEDIGLAVADVRRQELTRMDGALRRLKEGSYGLCEDCREEINLQRLQVEPYAPCCVRCQEKREKKEGPEAGLGRTL